MKKQRKMDELDAQDVTCGWMCGHFDAFNQCCWLSWWNKQEGDACDYGLVSVDSEVYTPKELERLLEAGADDLGSRG